DQIAGNNFRGESFNDQLFFPDQAIDDEAEAFLRGASDDDKRFLFFLRQRLDSVNFGKAIEADEGENLIAETQHFPLIDAADIAFLDAGNLDNGREWNG